MRNTRPGRVNKFRAALAFLVLCACGVVAEEGVRVDSTSLYGKLMVGYQGWFNAEGDGAGLGWRHWTRGARAPSPQTLRVDLWPDMSEYTPEERFATDWLDSAGRPLELFSSYKEATVARHFRWMREYGIDGAFLQRFPVDLRNSKIRHHMDTVLRHCILSAEKEGRTLAVMYDLSGLSGKDFDILREDWLRIQKENPLLSSPAYQKHRGRPLVALWGIGFNDQRPYSLNDCAELIRFFKALDVTLLLGVPCYWRTSDCDALTDPALLPLLAQADILSPWTVGRYATPEKARQYAENILSGDLAWCRDRQIDLMPVAFPGFSWHNMRPGAPFDEIPRRQGDFFRAQLHAQRMAGAAMQYIAMFDEADEATAVFKYTVPAGAGVSLVSREGKASDLYLQIIREASLRMKQDVRK